MKTLVNRLPPETRAGAFAGVYRAPRDRKPKCGNIQGEEFPAIMGFLPKPSIPLESGVHPCKGGIRGSGSGERTAAYADVFASIDF